VSSPAFFPVTASTTYYSLSLHRSACLDRSCASRLASPLVTVSRLCSVRPPPPSLPLTSWQTLFRLLKRKEWRNRRHDHSIVDARIPHTCMTSMHWHCGLSNSCRRSSFRLGCRIPCRYRRSTSVMRVTKCSPSLVLPHLPARSRLSTSTHWSLVLLQSRKRPVQSC